jgi:phosphoribosylformylglycinamidine synthase
MKFGVIIFPGSNCDQDSYHAAIAATGQKAAFLWHESRDLENCDAIIVPGGFAYGDYLRTGAIARFAPIMQELAKFAASGGLVIGICNGFQILCEAGLLPGALMRNAGLKYVCKFVIFRYCTPQGEITAEANPNGSLDNIAGISNEGRNVLGMMPHPDRCSDPLLGSADGAKIFQSMALSGVSAIR